ncbi:MAG: CopD family protein [Nitrospira sp.]|nr:CopD family protein [Nitrospira sp.]
MIEVAGALFRCLQLGANMMLLGGCVFLAIAEVNTATSGHPWMGRLKRTFPWLAILLLIGLIGVLATTIAQATGVSENAWSPLAWSDFLQKTRVGFIWILRAASALVVLAIALYIRTAPSTQWRYILCASVAALTIALGSLASHSAAEEEALLATLSYALHLIAASVWFGGLPGVVLAASSVSVKIGSPDERAHMSAVVSRFSALALPMMIAIVTSGVIVADRMIDTNYAGLVATTYGWLLITKLTLLVIILAIASRAKSVWVPSLKQDSKTAAAGGQKLRTWITVEFVLAVILVIVATLLANAVPVKHDIIDYWPYPFRFSIDATWDDWLVRTIVGIGVVLVILAGLMLPLGRKKHWPTLWRIAVPTVLGILGVAATTYPIAVQSYPETYRKTPVPFDAISIANGVDLFTANCIPCHGPQAKGNGVLAKTLPKQPVDLLTEPHTAMHTAGDFFHWLTYGRFNGIMPPFGEKFSEEERWDVLNFLHANARGYQSRIITPRILPQQPFMVTPNFSYAAYDGSSGTLKDYRGKQGLLLVLFSWPDSRVRLDQLRTASPMILKTGTAILGVPMTELPQEELALAMQGMPFPIVTQGAREISRSYVLFRRTLSIPDLFGEGNPPKHMEFLFDRFGYLRARWIPESDASGWTDLGLLTQQITQLDQEREILPPPGDHVH